MSRATLPSHQAWILIILIPVFGLLSLMVARQHHWLSFLEGLNLEQIKALILSLGPWGPVAYIAILITSVVISQIPGAPLAILAGTIWTPLWAAIFTIIGGFAGATLAYSLGWFLGAPFLQKITGKTFKFESDQSQRRLGGMIFLSRLLPIVPFDLLSYGAGVSRVSWLLYAIATLFGMIPSTFLLAYSSTINSSGMTTEIYRVVGLLLPG